MQAKIKNYSSLEKHRLNSAAAQNLQLLRLEIDDIDKELLALLLRRLELVTAIGLIKAEQSLPIRDHLREKKVLEKVRALSARSSQGEHAVRVYEQILAESCLAQESNKIVSLNGKV